MLLVCASCIAIGLVAAVASPASTPTDTASQVKLLNGELTKLQIRVAALESALRVSASSTTLVSSTALSIRAPRIELSGTAIELSGSTVLVNGSPVSPKPSQTLPLQGSKTTTN